jgi:serine phosphatase RsbU (regulator of sigma subunit)
LEHVRGDTIRPDAERGVRLRWFGRNKEERTTRTARTDGGLEQTQILSGDDRIDAQKVRTLLDTIAELISTDDSPDLLTSILDRAVRVVAAERGILFLFDKGDPGKLRIQAARDAAGNDLGEPIQYSTTVTRRVAADGEPMVWKVSSQEGVTDLSRSIVDMKLRAVMCVSLRVRDKRLGLIYVDSTAAAREFDRADLRYFDALAGALSIAVEHARMVDEARANERIHEQIKIARTIQEGLLPKDPSGVAGLDIAGRSVAAEHALGDYYDFVPLAGGRIAVAIGDVAGHGIGPALLMSSARSLLRSFFDDDGGASDPRRPRLAGLCARINTHFERDTDGSMFMSLFVALFETASRSFSWCNAGHTPPLLVRRGGRIEELKATGLAPGIERDTPFEERGPVTLEPEDVLVMLTDGVIEARGDEGMFGRERLQRVIGAHAKEGAAGLIEAIHRAVTRHCGGDAPADDWTIVVVRAR